MHRNVHSRKFLMNIFSDHSDVTADISDNSYSNTINEFYEIYYNLSDYSIIFNDRSILYTWNFSIMNKRYV